MPLKCGLLALLLGALAAVQPSLPSSLAEAIRRTPGLRLLDPAVDVVGYSVDELKRFGLWPSWITTDVDRDGRPDVIAVVVRSGPTPQYGVIAVHAGGAPVHWVAPLGDTPISGVAIGPARDTVTPLFCIECDSNSWYRWSGRGYEAELYAVGERITIASADVHEPVGLYARAARDSKLVFQVRPCSDVVVRRVAGAAADRWYFVETADRARLRGWLPASLTFSMECVG
jgi:hypothetical protein